MLIWHQCIIITFRQVEKRVFKKTEYTADQIGAIYASCTACPMSISEAADKRKTRKDEEKNKEEE